jgi:hypothetical protein
VTLATKFFLWPLVVWLAATRRRLAAVLACAIGALLLLLPWAAIGFDGMRDYPSLLRSLEDTVGEDSYTAYIVALDLGASPAVARWTGRPMRRAGRVFVAATLVLAAGFAAANAWLWLGDSRVYRERDPVYARVADRLAVDVCFSGSRLFVWGWAPAFYYEAGLRGHEAGLLAARPASRFVVLASAGLTGYVPGNPDGVRRPEPDEPALASAHWDMLMADFERTPPTYVVDTAPAGIYRWNRYPVVDYPRLQQYVAEGFERLDDVDRVRIHRRKGCAAR